MNDPANPSDTASHHRASIRFRLLLAVDLVLILSLAGLLVADYRHELTERLEQKHVALQEEAQILLPAVALVRPQGDAAVQQLIDRACRDMQDRSSPGHHIAVRLGDRVLQARSHDRSSPAFARAMAEAAQRDSHRGELAGQTIIVGSALSGGAQVYVAEFASRIYASARQQLAMRSLALGLVGMTVTLLVNLVLLRLVTRPLEKLVQTVRRIGRGELGTQSPKFKTAELSYLASEVNAMSRSLAAADQERNLQLAKAQRIQQHLRPRPMVVEGLELAMFAESATEVAGDYHDLIELPDGSWLICLADVTGHGVPAAMGAAILKALLAAVSESETDPATILARINRRFSHVTLAEDFASAVVMRWEPREARLTYASAGHEAGYIVSAGGDPRELASTGLLLGIDPEAVWDSRTVRLSPSDRVVLYTDGLTEARSPAGKMFGRPRLLEQLRTAAPGTAAELADELRKAVATHQDTAPPGDDLTLVVLEAVGAPAAEAEARSPRDTCATSAG